MITESSLSRILYLQDLMGCCCKENKGAEGEYDAEARHIVYLLELGVPFRTALHDVFSFFFRPGCLNPLDVSIIECQYYNIVQSYHV